MLEKYCTSLDSGYSRLFIGRLTYYDLCACSAVWQLASLKMLGFFEIIVTRNILPKTEQDPILDSSVA